MNNPQKITVDLQNIQNYPINQMIVKLINKKYSNDQKKSDHESAEKDPYIDDNTYLLENTIINNSTLNNHNFQSSKITEKKEHK